jgi:hypothetical protein
LKQFEAIKNAGGESLGGGASEVLSEGKMSDHPHPSSPLNPRNALKTLANPKETGIKSRASQRISDPAAKGFELFIKANPT